MRGARSCCCLWFPVWGYFFEHILQNLLLVRFLRFENILNNFFGCDCNATWFTVGDGSNCDDEIDLSTDAVKVCLLLIWMIFGDVDIWLFCSKLFWAEFLDLKSWGLEIYRLQMIDIMKPKSLCVSLAHSDVSLRRSIQANHDAVVDDACRVDY